MIGLVWLLATVALSKPADSIELFLNSPLQAEAPADECKADHCKALLKLINGSKSSIDLALYGLRNQTAIMNALKKAKKRGVVIRGVVDMDVSNHNIYSGTPDLMKLIGNVVTDHETDVATAAKRRFYERRDRCPRPEGHVGPLLCGVYDLGDTCLLLPQASKEKITFEGEIMHHKFVISDHSAVWMGSTNVSDSGTGGYNANLALVIKNAAVAQQYTTEFETMFVQKKFHKQKPKPTGSFSTTVDDVQLSVLFSPMAKPITKGVRPKIREAKESIDVAVFFLTEKRIVADLIAAHNRGVKVRVLLDASGASNEYSKHQVLRAAGISVKVESFGGKMHAKSAVIDGEILIAGSMNWTGAGEGGNDENTIIAQSKRLGGQYTRWFNTLWSAVSDEYLTAAPAPESRASGTACTDGSDNDHDGLRDDEDPQCAPEYLPPPQNTGRIIAKPPEGCSIKLYDVGESN